MRNYRTKTGRIQKMQSLKTLARAILGDTMTGFCLACGNDQSGVEPDARRYICEVCGAAKVYGAEELVMMGICYDQSYTGKAL